MKFALVNGERQDAQPHLSGNCPFCGQVMIAKCGEIKIRHWAHKGRRNCDPWWENETEWHRASKDQFPAAWQEIVQHAESGERHIADVKTDHGWAIEFQHSPLKAEERSSRETFYRKLVWVVHGARRKKDLPQFREAVNRGSVIGLNAPGSISPIRIPFADECVILQEWTGSPAPVFIDFEDGPMLWWILKGTPDGSVYVAPFPRSFFVAIHRGGVTQDVRDNFEKFVNELGSLISQYEASLRLQRAGPFPAAAIHRHPMRPIQRSRRL